MGLFHKTVIPRSTGPDCLVPGPAAYFKTLITATPHNLFPGRRMLDPRTGFMSRWTRIQSQVDLFGVLELKTVGRCMGNVIYFTNMQIILSCSRFLTVSKRTYTTNLIEVGSMVS